MNIETPALQFYYLRSAEPKKACDAKFTPHTRLNIFQNFFHK